MPYLKSYRSILLLLLVLLMIFAVQGQENSPQIDSTLNDSLLVDRDGDGRLDAGDTLRYTLEITNCGTAAAENVQFTGQVDPNTQFLANSVQVGAPQPAATCPPQTTNPNPDTNPGNGNPPVPPASGPPAIRNTTPANSDTEVALNANITVRFNKRVDVTGDWFEIFCTISGTFNISSANVTVTGGPNNFVFDPNVDLQVGETCTVTIFATSVSDRDSNDPPDNMAANYVFSFATETPPTVASTNPTNGATAIPNTNDIVITFDEPVNVSAASFTLECPAGTPFAGGFAVSGSGSATVTINPTGNLPSGTACQVVIIAANVSDVDANDPPDLLDGNGDNVEGDDYTFSFTTDVDAPPTVTNITPANGATNVASNTTIEITFSELVDITSAADFSIECPVGTPIGFTVTTPAALPSSTTTIIITPAGNLPDATTCTLSVYPTVTDSDMDDPPDDIGLLTSTFTTEAPPSVTTTNPANGATGISTGSNIVIDFDEAVDVTTSSFSIECPAGGTSFTYNVAGSGSNSITLDPTSNLLANQTCTVTVIAAQVGDSDLIDPPNNMTADYVFSFDTIADTAPVASSPLDGATGVATASNIVINFNEPVDVTAGAFVVECPVGSSVPFTTIPALPTTSQTSITLDPTGVLPATSTCAVTVLATNVTDSDADEPPDNMAADYSFTFDTIVDLAPTVDQPGIAPASTSTGANSASLNTTVSTSPTITIPFSEAVDAGTGAFTLTCNAAPVALNMTPSLPAVGATSIDVSPAAPIAEGVNCVLTVVAANINDSDSDDPPNFMVTDFTLSFSSDTAPAETLTETEVGAVFQNVTGAGSTNVDLDSDIQITFNEAVFVTFPANGLQCPFGNNIPVTVTTNSATTIVLNPNTNLPLNTLCVLNIPAANISDVDTADAPDNPLLAVSHSFQTVDDDAPTVTTNPAAGGSNIAVNSNITVTFNEAVTLTGAWFDLTCSISGNRVSTGELTGTDITIIENTPDLVYTIDPTVDLAAGDICTVTIDSANVVDNDVIDPPNELDGDASADILDGDADDYVAIFSTQDMPPQVLSTSPAGPIVGAGEVVTITFTEAVNVAAGAFSFECPAGTPLSSGFNTSVALPATGITTIDLTPVDPLPFGADCTVTIDSTLVVDVDPVDPPNFLDGDASGDLIDDADNFVLNFTVDAEPTLLGSQVEIGGVLSPAAAAVNVDLDTNIVLTFSEAVNADLTSFDLECPAGTDIAFTVLGTGTTTITVDPTPAFLTINTLCDFDIIAANITDVDTFDAPDTLAADVNFSFTTVNDDFPEVSTAEVEVGGVFTALPLVGTYVDADTDLRLTFSEAVIVTGNWAELSCTVSGPQNVSLGLAVTDADPVFTLNPATDLTPGEDCTLTVFAAQIDDDDAIDPPTNMVADAVFTFTVLDTPPQVDTATSLPVDGNIVPDTQLVTLDFTEMVDIQAGAISFVCDATPVTFTPALPLNNVLSLTLTPDTTLPYGALCTVTLTSTLIQDDDTADAPDDLDGDANDDIVDGDADDFVLTFAVDEPPAVTAVNVFVAGVPSSASGATNVDADTDILIGFDEAVTVTGNWAELSCTLSGPQNVSLGLAVTDADPTFTLNPATDLTPGEDCTLTIFAAQVTDDDAIEPPDNMLADAVFNFTIQDVPPQVDTATSTPADGDIVPNDQIVTLNFTEAVDIAAGAIDFVCGPTTITFTPALPVTNVNTIALDPSITLPSGATCTVTLESTLVTDVDTADAPDELDGDENDDLTDGDIDDFVLTFTVDAPPAPLTVTVEVANVPTFLPLAGAQVADLDTNIVITFDEAVDSTAAGVTLECPVGTPIAFAGIPVTNNTSITVNPGADLPGDTVCQLTLVHTGISDTDLIDPPNLLDGNDDGIEGDSIALTFRTQPAAVDDAYTVTPHLTYDSGAATLSVRDNDQPTTVTITGFGATAGTANGTVANGTNFITADGAGGRIIMNADGTFFFYPDAGDTAASGTATFFYTVTGGDTAQVTLTFEAEELLWFVDNTPGTTVCTGTNVGTQACPSADLATVVAVDTAADTIFVASGNYTCGILLELNEKLIGDGSSSDLQTVSGISPVAGSNFVPYASFSGTDPVLTSSAADCVTLASNTANSNIIRGLTIGNTGNFVGITEPFGSPSFGTVTISETTINGTGQIVVLDGTTGGTINASFDSLSSDSSDADAPALRIANSIVNITSPSTTINNPSSIGISLGSNSGTGFNLGTTTVSKTSTGDGVLLINNSAPVTFSSLAISTSLGSALLTGGQTGLVTVSNNTGAISTTTGAAVVINNSIGNTTPLALNLGAISSGNSSSGATCLTGTSPAVFCATGATGTVLATSLTATGSHRHGIRINNSSAAFTFATVNISGMTGTTAEVDADVNGYPDNDGDGDGVFLSSNTGSFTINSGTISNTNSSGADNVDIRSSSNITINNTTLSGAGKSNFQAINMTGTGSFNNGTVTGSGVVATSTGDGFYFIANTGTLTLFNIDNVTCTVTASNCVDYRAYSTHSATLDIGAVGDTGVFRTNQNSIQTNSYNTASLNLNVTDIDFSPATAGQAGMRIASEDSSTTIARIIDNNFTNIGVGNTGVGFAAIDGIVKFDPYDTSTMRVRFEDNVIDMVNDYYRRGVQAISTDTVNQFELYVINNIIDTGEDRAGIFFRTDATLVDGPALTNGNIFIQGNQILAEGGGLNAHGIHIWVRDQAGSNNLRFDVRNNNINTTSSADAWGIYFDMEGIATIANATIANNTITTNQFEIAAQTQSATNNLCMNIFGHTSGDIYLLEGAGDFNLTNRASINGLNAGAAITLDPSAADFDDVGACPLPVSSGLVQENSLGDIYASLPAEGETESSDFANILGEAFSFGAQTVHAQSNFNIPLGPINIGTIPANSTVIVTFDVVVNAVIPSGTSSVSLQGILSGSNFASILTDDPETPLDMDVTLTALDSLQAVSALPQTGEESWWQSLMIWGLRLGLLSIVVAGLVAIRRRFFRTI